MLSLASCLWVKFYWSTAMLIHFCIIGGCFCTKMADLSSCNRDHVDHKAKNIYCASLLPPQYWTTLLLLEAHWQMTLPQLCVSGVRGACCSNCEVLTDLVLTCHILPFPSLVLATAPLSLKHWSLCHQMRRAETTRPDAYGFWTHSSNFEHRKWLSEKVSSQWTLCSGYVQSIICL